MSREQVLDAIEEVCRVAVGWGWIALIAFLAVSTVVTGWAILHGL